MATRACQEIKNTVSLFRLLGGREQVLLHPGLCPSYQHYSGVVFCVFEMAGEVRRGHRVQRRHRSRVAPVAVGGRWAGCVCVCMCARVGVYMCGIAFELMHTHGRMHTHAHPERDNRHLFVAEC